MKKLILVGGGLVLAGGIAAVVISRRSDDGYDDDEIDTGLAQGEFGERGAPAPEQKMSSAETRTDITPEKLSMAARIGESTEAIRKSFPAVSEEEINGADGDLDRLAELIAKKNDGKQDSIKRELSDILARETPRPSYPAH